MVAHDVSRELRGEHGKWTKGGSVIHRLAGEATKAAEGKHKEGDRVKYKTGAMGTVHHVDDKGVPHVVWDKGRGKPVRTPVHHLTGATSPAAAEKAAPDKPAPVPKLSGPEDVVRKLAAEEQAKRSREATTTETLRKLQGMPGGGVQARPFHEVHAEYQAKSQTLQRALDNPGRYGPGVIPANKRQLDQLDAELRKMGARKTGGSFEMPPKAGTPEHAAEKLKNDLASITEQLHEQHHEAGAPLYTPEQLVEARRSDMAAQVRAGQKTIVAKVPSGSEIQMSAATAKYLLSKKPIQRQAGSRGGVPAPTAGGLSPELRAQMQRIQAEQKAKMEAENKGRGGVTERKDVLTTPESAAYLAKLPGGGVQAKSKAKIKLDAITIHGMSKASLEHARKNDQISAAEYAKEIARRTGSLRGIRLWYCSHRGIGSSRSRMACRN